ncbi:hypothetical protein [Neisseria dentiae]|nr:hypothetical protein [Neisseria dentiae]
MVGLPGLRCGVAAPLGVGIRYRRIIIILSPFGRKTRTFAFYPKTI